MENNLELLMQAKNGDDNAKEKLVEQNLGLVWSVARRFMGRGYDIEDLFQIGCIGLIKCIEKFSFEYNVQFSTYAVPLIQGEIKRFLRDSGAVKVSRSLKEMNMKVEIYRQKVMKEKGYDPGIEEIASALSFDACDIVMALEARVELEPIDAPGVMTKSEEYSQDIVDRVTLIELLNNLAPNERELIRLRYFEEKTQQETGKVLGLSQVQVSRMEKKILEKMKENA